MPASLCSFKPLRIIGATGLDARQTRRPAGPQPGSILRFGRLTAGTNGTKLHAIPDIVKNCMRR